MGEVLHAHRAQYHGQSDGTVRVILQEELHLGLLAICRQGGAHLLLGEEQRLAISIGEDKRARWEH
jgi:hypothetical protein